MRDSSQPPSVACRGTTFTELLVALALLSSIMTVVLPLSVRIARQGQVYRQRCVALEELVNQMEQLARLAPAELPTAERRLELSPENAGQLADARLQLELEPLENAAATRIRLTITWTNRLGFRNGPLSMTAWVYDTSGNPESTDEQ